MVAPVHVTIDHAAPMLIRWGRGHEIGLFAVRERTPVEIPGVDPLDLARPDGIPDGVPDTVRIHDRRLWMPMDSIGPGKLGRGPAPLGMVLDHLSRQDGQAGGMELIVPPLPPLRAPYGPKLHTARAMQAAGGIPASAEEHVSPARQAASRAVSAHAETHLLHDGVHLYTRLPVPLLDPASPGKALVSLRNGLHRPGFLHARLGPHGRLPFGEAESIPMLEGQAEGLARFLEGIDTGNEDIARFLLSAPAAMIPALRATRDPGTRPLQERLWPLVLSAARGEEPADGTEAAAETVREAALCLLAAEHPVPQGPANTFHRLYADAALRSYVGFVERVVRPAMAGPVLEEDEAAFGQLVP